MKEREVLFGLHETPGIGWVTISIVKELAGSFSNLSEMSEKEVCKLPFPPDHRGQPFPENKKKWIYQGSRASFVGERLRQLEQKGFQFTTYADEHHYPLWLREIDNPPWVLYYSGNYELLRQPVLAVVGTRIPTTYGKRVARQISAELSRAGWHVASGLAAGIDAEAHWGALEGEGKTIAVLGSPIDVPYPRENTALYHRILEEGLVLSEYPIGTPIHKGMFPERNRIISGISMGTVVVEADIKSGSLITSSHALKQGREVFAVPGPISSPKSAGTLDLIKSSGAHLTRGIEDIFAEFRNRNPEYCQLGEKAEEGKGLTVSLTADEKNVLSHLSDIPVTFDRLYAVTEFDFGHLHSVLISLLMKKKIEQHPGSSYILLY